MGILEGILGRKILSLVLRRLDLRCLWDMQEESPNISSSISKSVSRAQKVKSDQRHVWRVTQHMPEPSLECTPAYKSGEPGGRALQREK